MLAGDVDVNDPHRDFGMLLRDEDFPLPVERLVVVGTARLGAKRIRASKVMVPQAQPLQRLGFAPLLLSGVIKRSIPCRSLYRIMTENADRGKYEVPKP